jgi:hypothetical protein
MNSGWFKTHRKIIDSVVFQSDKCLKIWVWCLAKTNHSEGTSLIGRQKVLVKKGQFIMGSLTAEEKLRMAKSTIWYWLDFLVREGMIGIKKTNKYSIITIRNWDKYQEVGNKSESNRETNENQKRTNKNEKNDKNYIYSENEKNYLGSGIDSTNFSLALGVLEIGRLTDSQLRTIKKLMEKYPSRDYELQALKCKEWWFEPPKTGWKRPLLAFSNWLERSKVDEGVLQKKQEAEEAKKAKVREELYRPLDPISKKEMDNNMQKLRDKMQIRK